jgi:hypothetical protein
MYFFKNLIKTFKINQIRSKKRNNEIKRFMIREQMNKDLLQNRVSLTYMKNNLKR